MTHIFALPDELVEYIFLHLLPYGEIQSCRLVCRSWHRLANGALARLQQLLLRCRSFQWFLLQSMDSGRNIAERCSHASAFCNDCVFIFGGCTASYTTFNDLWKFDLGTRAWIRPLPAGTYPTPKACATMVTYKGMLVLFGGWSKSSPNPIHQTTIFFNEMHQYSPATNVWTPVHSPSSAPHLAGHSASVCGDWMIVFGGSLSGSGSSNTVWAFNFISQEWFTPETSTVKPQPRYGQSQVKLDDEHILILGGCAGPSLIFSDVWLLTIVHGGEWLWEEIRVENSRLSPPQIWSHPGCRLGERVLVLSRPPRWSQTRLSLSSDASSHHGSLQSGLQQEVSGSCSSASSVESSPQATRQRKRLLISSRSLDEHTPPTSPRVQEKASQPRSIGELQRAKSIPTIIVGEIPTLVVTDTNQDAAAAQVTESPQKGTHATADGNRCLAADDSAFGSDVVATNSQTDSAIAFSASSLIPYQAVAVDLQSAESCGDREQSGGRPGAVSATASSDSTTGAATFTSDANKLHRNTPYPSVKPNAMKNRAKQLEMLNRMEDYIRCRCRQLGQRSSGLSSAPAADGGLAASSGERSENRNSATPSFRPSSPPPVAAGKSESDCVPLNPMHIYFLDIANVLTTRSVCWSVDEQSSIGAPEDTILYSLVKGRGELVLFGGLRNSPLGAANSSSNLDVIAPFHNAITNETYIIRPEISM